MPTQASFRSSNGDLYVYLENPTLGSCAIGTDFSDNNKLKIVMSDAIDNVTPSGTAQLIIDPDTNGDITVTPRGAGDLIVSYLSTGVVQSSSAGVISSSAGSDGQLLIGDTGSAPLWQNLTAGTGISITNGAASISISSTGGGMTWNTVTTAGPILTVKNNGYIENYGITQVSFVLPTTPTVGDVVELCCTSALGGAFVGIAGTVTIQGLGYSAQLAIGTSLGSAPFGDRYCCIKMLCVATAGGNVDTWQIVSMTGNWVFQN
jgi:hypothetical protein